MEKEEQQIIALHEEALRGMIHTIRGVQVMLDKDLARLYEVKPIRLREQMKRNSNRFPEDFVFQLTGEEVDLLVSQNAIPSRKQLGGALPYVFTEQGIAAISGVLTGDRAVEVNIAIMRAFVAMRRYLAENAGILHRLDSLMLSIARAWSGHTFSREKMKTREFCEKNAPRKLYTLLFMLG